VPSCWSRAQEQLELLAADALGLVGVIAVEPTLGQLLLELPVRNCSCATPYDLIVAPLLSRSPTSRARGGAARLRRASRRGYVACAAHSWAAYVREGAKAMATSRMDVAWIRKAGFQRSDCVLASTSMPQATCSARERRAPHALPSQRSRSTIVNVPAIEPLVNDRESAARPHQKFNLVTPAVDEGEDVPLSGSWASTERTEPSDHQTTLHVGWLHSDVRYELRRTAES